MVHVSRSRDTAAARVRRRILPAATPLVDRTRDRTAVLNQLLLGSVVFTLGILVALGPSVGDRMLFFTGIVIIMLITGATLVVPWNRIPFGWVALIPAIDIVAIALMQIAIPGTAMGLLWIFPAMWLASGFGLLGLLGVVVGITAIVIALFAGSRAPVTYAEMLVPMVLIAVAAVSHLNARRSDAQRRLLATQAQLLRRLLARTRRQEQEVTEVLDAVDFGVIRISPDGAIAVTNDAHARLQRALGGFDSDVPAFRDDGTTPLPRDELPISRALRGEAFDGQIVWLGMEPEPRQALSVSVRRLFEADGTDGGAVLISRDITTELTALQARDDLVASVSHELRTPLTAILGYLDLVIESPDLPEDVRQNLDIAERNAERLLRIIADILAASSSSASVEASLTPMAIDAGDILRAAREAAAARAATRGITLDVGGIHDAPVWGDPLRLRQVVDNLVANAITYNNDGGTVFLACTSDGVSTWILVRDTGPGITEDERVRLFQRFYKAGVARRTGTGLGLAISRDIVRAHGGEIAVRSTPGAGSTFIVRLPALPAEGRTP